MPREPDSRWPSRDLFGCPAAASRDGEAAVWILIGSADQLQPSVVFASGLSTVPEHTSSWTKTRRSRDQWSAWSEACIIGTHARRRTIRPAGCAATRKAPVGRSTRFPGFPPPCLWFHKGVSLQNQDPATLEKGRSRSSEYPDELNGRHRAATTAGGSHPRARRRAGPQLPGVGRLVSLCGLTVELPGRIYRLPLAPNVGYRMDSRSNRLVEHHNGPPGRLRRKTAPAKKEPLRKRKT
jgi:hypothetical protein